MSGIIFDQLVNEPSHESRADPFAGVNPAVNENCLFIWATCPWVGNGEDRHVVSFMTASTAALVCDVWIFGSNFVDKFVNLRIEEYKNIYLMSIMRAERNTYDREVEVIGPGKRIPRSTVAIVVTDATGLRERRPNVFHALLKHPMKIKMN